MRKCTVPLGRVRAGFTLLEVLIVIALIGLLSAVLVGGSVALLRDNPATADEEFKAIVMKCRRLAVTGMAEVRLSFDAKNRTYLLARNANVEKQVSGQAGDLQVEFLPASTGSSVLIGGSMAETDVLTHVVFYPDGACSPFRVQLRTGGPARILRFDPWTCAEIMEGTP